jgi:hypothetical protein
MLLTLFAVRSLSAGSLLCPVKGVRCPRCPVSGFREWAEYVASYFPRGFESPNASMESHEVRM